MQIDKGVLDSIESKYDKYLELWKELVGMESPFFYKEGVDKVCDRILRVCKEELRLYTRVYENVKGGNGLCACTCPFEEFQNGIVFMAHMDTVHEVGSFQPVVCMDDSFLYGPGCGDCKAGIVMALMCMEELKELRYVERPVKLILVGDEECGRDDDENFYYKELPGASVVFNCEPGKRGQVVTSRKSSIGAIYEISGEAAHVGYLKGLPKSAIREAAYKILELEEYSDYDTMTFSTGEIQGGSIFTAVPDRCTFKANCRIKDQEMISKVLEILEKVKEHTHVNGTVCTLKITGNLIPMSASRKNDWLCQRFSKASEELGFGPLEGIFVGGGSDAAYAVDLGIPVICATGPVGDYQHTLRERALLSSLTERAKIHLKTILDLPKEIDEAEG